MIFIFFIGCLFYGAVPIVCLADGHTHSNLSTWNIDPKIPSIAELNDDPDMPELLMDDKVLYTKGQSDAIARRMEAHRAYARSEACNRYADGVFKDEYGYWRTLDGDFSPERPPQKTIITPPRDNNRPIIFDPPSPEPPQPEFIENPAPLPEVHEPSCVPSIPDRTSSLIPNPQHDSHEKSRRFTVAERCANDGLNRMMRSDPAPRTTARYERGDRIFLCQLTPADFETLCANGTFNKQTILSDYELYGFTGFLSFARTLPHYEQFMLDLEYKIDSNKKFSDATFDICGFGMTGSLWWKKSDFHAFVHKEASRVRQAQATRHREAEEQARKIEAARQQQEAEYKKWAQEEHVRRQKCMDVSDTQSLETLINEWTKEIEEYEEDEVAEQTLESDRSHYQEEHLRRLYARLEAVRRLDTDKKRYYDYAAHVPKLILSNENTSVFDNTYGSALDCQLHYELVETANNMALFVEDNLDDGRLQTIAPEIYRLAAQAKREQHMEKAFELSDNCFTFEKFLEDSRKLLRNWRHGIKQSFAKRGTVDYWKEHALSSLQTAFIILSEVGGQDAAFERTLAECWAGLPSSEAQRLEDRAAAIRESSEEMRKKWNAMSDDEFAQQAAEFGADLILDTITTGLITKGPSLVKSAAQSIAKNGVKAAAKQAVKSAARDFTNRSKRLLATLRAAYKKGIVNEDYLVEVAGFGAVMLEEGEEIVHKAVDVIKKRAKDGKKGLSPAKQAAAALLKEELDFKKWYQTKLKQIRSITVDIAKNMKHKTGHTFQRHTGQTANDLIRRACKIEIPGASGFYSPRTAIVSVQQSLRHHAVIIADWLADKTIKDNLALKFNHRNPIGYGVLQGKTSVNSGLTRSLVVLQKDIQTELGFFVLSSFPIIK